MNPSIVRRRPPSLVALATIVVFFLRSSLSCTAISVYLGLGIMITGVTAFAKPSEISLNFKESASNVDVDLTILEGESAQQEIQLCMPSCPNWVTGLVQGDLDFNLYRLEANVPEAQGHLAIGETGLSIELSDAAADDNLIGGMTLFVDEPLIDLSDPVTVELLFSVEDSIFTSLSTTVDVINLNDGGSDGKRFFFSGSPPSSASFPLFLPEDDPPLDPFAVRTTFTLSGSSHATVVFEGVRIRFSVPEPSAIIAYLLGALGLLCTLRRAQCLPLATRC